MDETARFGLPLVDGAQAQKHVTVNEALTRLDALAGGVAASRAASTPPTEAADGALFIVGPEASGAWAGQAGRLAIRDGAAWDFAAPYAGQRLWLADEGREVVYDGAGWLTALGATRHGAGSAFGIATVDHAVEAGAVSLTPPILPDKAIVMGVTGRVLESLGGDPALRWRLGVEGAPDRYGAGYGAAAGAFAHGVTSAPLAYYGETALRLEAQSGVFEGGLVRLCAHYIALTPPRMA